MNSHSNTQRPSTNSALLSVVLPVYNEAEVLSTLLDRVIEAAAEAKIVYEIIFVDDGSTDDSPNLLDHLAADNHRVRVVHFSRNFGHQAAVQAGLAHAHGDAVVLMDSDMQDAPEAIPRFVEQWRAGYDVVYALRTERKEGRLKKFLFTAFHRFLASVASVDVPADAGIFGLIDRRVVREIVALGERDRYFPGLRSWVGFRQTGIEVQRNARYDDHARVSMLGLFRLAKTAVFSFSGFPLVVFHAIGMAAAVMFVGLSLFSLSCKLFTTFAIPGWTSYILAASFFGALNALGISILGEYVIRIYDQVRARPLYLVDRTVNMEAGETEETAGDRPYVELMEQAAGLLEAGTIEEKSTTPAECDMELSRPVKFPQPDA